MRNWIFESERIKFSIWDKNDEELAMKLWGNAEVSRYISAKGYFTEDEIKFRLEKEIANEEKYKIQYWPIFLKESGEFIGCCGLRPYNLENKIYEGGVHILPEYWHKGLASEAMKKIIDYSFNELNARNLFVGHNPKNLASKKMIEKLGFHFIREEYYEPTGLMHPSYLYKKEQESE